MNTLVSLPDDILLTILTQLDLPSLFVFFYICRSTLSLIRLPRGAVINFVRIVCASNPKWQDLCYMCPGIFVHYDEIVMCSREFAVEGFRITHNSGFAITFTKPYIPLVLRTCNETIERIGDMPLMELKRYEQQSRIRVIIRPFNIPYR